MSSVVAAAALLGGAFAQIPPPLYQLICGEYGGGGGGKINIETLVDGKKCGQVIDEQLIQQGIMLDATGITASECTMPLTGAEGSGMTVADGLMYMQYHCCEDASPMQVPSGPCGDHFPDGTMCISGSGQFKPMQGTGGFHCDGDEGVPTAANCSFEGQSGWDDTADEKCDVSRMNFGDDKQAEACASMGGSWEEVSCLSAHGWLHQMMNQMMNAGTDVCTDQTMQGLIPMWAHSCCGDGMPIMRECESQWESPAPGTPTQPAHPDLCMDMTQFTPQEDMFGSETCKGDEAITEKSKCMPGGREGAWDDNGPDYGGDKCDVTRLISADSDDTALLHERACLQLGGSWEAMKCQEMLDMMPFFYCAVDNFEMTWNWFGGGCCGTAATTLIQCDPGSAPSPGGPQGQCTQVPQAAVNSAKMKGYEPKYC